jgi:hypothetical protein
VTRAWVADLGQGWGFSAHVDFGEASPFSVLPGPNQVTLEEVLGWARAHRRFSVQFLVESASLEAAQEDCLRVIRSAWKQAGIEARAGDDWDGSSLEVTPAAGVDHGVRR